jgi:uncharacterized membrane protein
MTDDGTTQVHVANPAAEEYLGGVRAALADLPAPEVAEILDDVRAHLADLTAELGGAADLAALTARLGPPSEYAAELRAAAGYPPATQEVAGPSHGLARLAVAALVAATVLVGLAFVAREPAVLLVGALAGLLGVLLVGRDGPAVPSVAALPEVRQLAAARPAASPVTGFVASLQPAWWVVRALVAAALVVGVVLGGDLPAVLLVVLVAVPVSVWIGYRTRRDRRWLWAVVPLNTLAALLLLVLVPGLFFAAPSPESYPPAAYQMGLWQDSERQIRDIRPVDAAGNPLTGVYLFDQDGRPIDTSRGTECTDEYGNPMGGDESNAPYPRGTWDYDPRTGACRLTPPAPLVAAVVPATPVPTPGAEPTTAPSRPAQSAPESAPVPTPPSAESVAPTPSAAPPGS